MATLIYTGNTEYPYQLSTLATPLINFHDSEHTVRSLAAVSEIPYEKHNIVSAVLRAIENERQYAY